MGRVVLIKFVLLALPMFQFSTLLTPKGIPQAMSQLIRKFLWQGGASNHKKLHLVQWETVTQPKSRGRLGIWDPEITNLAMGAKFLWRLITGDNDWWKQALSSKCRLGKRIRSMDKPHLNYTGYQIWKLIKGVSPFFREHLSWILGNGKSIKIWQDRIFGVTFNPSDENLSDLKGWMLGWGKRTLFDISAWNDNGSWKDWNLGNVPQHLEEQDQGLITLLKGAAPI